MSFWSAESFREIIGGRWVARRRGGEPAHLTGINTDSRTLERGQVFLALRGDHFDGHRFLATAANAGAPLLIVDDAEAAADVPEGRCDVLQVADTQRALTQLATAWRRRLGGRVIAVTGSAGKTTTKHLIHTVLSSHYVGSASPKSFNNHIGVPLTLLAARPGDAYTVVEVGTNAPGEIAALARIVEPDIAMVTHVGAAHLEGLGGPEGVLREKASLLTHLREGGLAIVNGDIAGLQDYRKVVPTMLSFGESAGCDLRMTDYTAEAGGARFTVNGRWNFRLPMLGRHSAMNALAAIAVCRHMQLSEQQIADALAKVRPAMMRLEVQQVGPAEGGVTLINDAYNANPDSTAAAIDVLAEYPAAGRRVAVLGDMLELGEEAAERHRRAGEQVAEAGVDAAVFAGRLMMFAAEAAAKRLPAERVLALPDWPEGDATERAAAMIEPGDTVLLKGSRGMRMERLIDAIVRRLTATDRPTTAGG